jgi:hypothetical protein
MTDRNTTYTESARADAAKLEAILAEVGEDIAKLEARLAKDGYSKDSRGQWFRNGQLIPYPPVPSASGITSFRE